MKNVKDVLDKVFEKDLLFINVLNEIKVKKPSFVDMFKGTFKDRLQVIVKAFATFAVTYKQKYEKDHNINDDQLIDELANKMALYIPSLPIPYFGKYINVIICHFLISYGINYVNTASPITTIYTKSFENVN